MPGRSVRRRLRQGRRSLRDLLLDAALRQTGLQVRSGRLHGLLPGRHLPLGNDGERLRRRRSTLPDLRGRPGLRRRRLPERRELLVG